MEWMYLLRWAHILGATVLLGTGAGIAFFMVMAHRTRDPQLIAHTASIVVIADWIFTASAVIVQPVTGVLLARAIGWPLTEAWLVASVGLYVFTGLFWLPVIWLQHQLRDIARQSVRSGTSLPDRYYALYRLWFACGFPAFFAVLAIVWLMVSRPVMG